jgi:hypothetical protein
MIEQRVRAELSAAMSRTSARSELLASAENGVRRLEAEGLPWSAALATMFRAGLAAARGDAGLAAKVLADAEGQFEAIDMRLYAAACRWRRGEMHGGEEGDLLVREASARFEDEGTRHPQRMTRLYLPAIAEFVTR